MEQADQAAASCSQHELWQRPSAAPLLRGKHGHKPRRLRGLGSLSLTTETLTVFVLMLWTDSSGWWLMLLNCGNRLRSMLSMQFWRSSSHSKSFKYGCFNFYLLYSGKGRAKCILMFNICQLKWRYTVTGLIVAVMCVYGLPKADSCGLKLPPDRFLRKRWGKMIRDEFYLMVHGVSIIGCAYNAYAGSIESRQGMHHNLVHLWKRAICCCRGQSDALWIKFAFVNHTAPPKTTDRCKNEAGRRRSPDRS